MQTVGRSSSVQNLPKDAEQSNNRCVCEICTCGMHRCPQPHIAFKGESTQHHDYKAYNVHHERVQKCAYKLAQNHYDPELIKSTYRVNYQPYLHQATHSRTHYAYQPNNAKFNDETEYKKSYVVNQIAVEPPIKCSNQFRPSTAKFEATSTYRDQFKQKKTDKDAPAKHYAYQPNNLPFYATTTYGETYQGGQNEGKTQTCQTRYTPSQARFQGKSSYREQFHPHQVDPKRRCLIEELPYRPRECSPGKTHLHYCASQNRWN